jgi:hypothetical protein
MRKPRNNCLNGAQNNKMQQGKDQNETLDLECRLTAKMEEFTKHLIYIMWT